MAQLLTPPASKSNPTRPCTSVRRTLSSKETILSRIGLEQRPNVTANQLQIAQLSTYLVWIKNRQKKKKITHFTLWMQTRRKERPQLQKLRPSSEKTQNIKTDDRKGSQDKIHDVPLPKNYQEIKLGIHNISNAEKRASLLI